MVWGVNFLGEIFVALYLALFGKKMAPLNSKHLATLSRTFHFVFGFIKNFFKVVILNSDKFLKQTFLTFVHFCPFVTILASRPAW